MHEARLMPTKFYLSPVSWHTHAAQLKAVRQQVFIIEQQVPIALEWDEQDEAAQHILALNHAHEPVGCARLLANGSIGRMAVLKAWRGCGIGTALLDMAVAIHLQQGAQTIQLSAQMHAIPFYEKAGFVVCSQPYLDANIMHVDMQLSAAKS